MKILSLLMMSLAVAPAWSQIQQLHPEICGTPDRVIGAPNDFAVVIDHSQGSGELFIGRSSDAKKVEVPRVIDGVDQVCPLSDGRIVLFGGTYNGTNINIIDVGKTRILDSFDGFDPRMSPDQRWIAYRKFYPIHTEEEPSEEYLLYDLTRSAIQNRPPSVGSDDSVHVGLPVFPVVKDHVVFDNIGLPPEQTHTAGSQSFFWSPDSHTLLFGDEVQNKLSLVLVEIKRNGDTLVRVRPVPVREVCNKATASGSPVRIFAKNAAWAEESGDRLVQIRFDVSSDACPLPTLSFRLDEFQPATTEVHMEPKRKRSVVDQYDAPAKRH